MKDSGDGFPSGLLLFDTSPGPAITRSPLCIKKDISTEVLLPRQGKGSTRMPEGTKDSAGGSRESWDGHKLRQLDGDEPESASFITISACYYYYH